MDTTALTPFNGKSSMDGIKELYNKPGGKFAKIMAIIAAGGIGFLFLKYALPFLVASAANLILFVIELAALALIVGVVTSKPFWRALSLIWLQIMRKLYGFVVNIDPIAILQNAVNEMKKKYSTVETSVNNLQAIIVKMERNLADYKKQFEDNINIRKVTEEKLKNETDELERTKLTSKYQLVSNQITRLSDQIKKQEARLETSKKYLKIMKKLLVMVDYKVRDTQNEIGYLKDDYEQAKATNSAMKSIKDIMKGCLTTTMEEELAMESVMNTVNTSIAEMERLIDGSNDILVNWELQTDANVLKAEQIVADFERGGFTIFKNEPTQSEMKALGVGTPLEAIEASASEIASPRPVTNIKGNYF